MGSKFTLLITGHVLK